MSKDTLVSVDRCECGGYFKVINAYVDEYGCGVVETVCDTCGMALPMLVVPEKAEGDHE